MNYLHVQKYVVYSHDNEGDVDTDAEHDGNMDEAINLCKPVKHRYIKQFCVANVRTCNTMCKVCIFIFIYVCSWRSYLSLTKSFRGAES